MMTIRRIDAPGIFAIKSNKNFLLESYIVFQSRIGIKKSNCYIFKLIQNSELLDWIVITSNLLPTVNCG